MEARATVRYLRIAPRKLRLVVNAIRRLRVVDALSRLYTLNKKGSKFVERGLKSAVASAKQKQMQEDRLYVADIRVDGGPVFKRFSPRAMGRADRVLKRTSHLSIVLKEKAQIVKKLLTAAPKTDKGARPQPKAAKPAVAKAS